MIRQFLPDIVSPNQVAFVPGRQIQDNIVVSQEVLHKFKNAKGNSGFIAWQIDLAKAYKLQWHLETDIFWSFPFVEGVKWRVGDGCSVGFWTDDWVPGIGRLLRFATLPISNDQINKEKVALIAILIKSSEDCPKMRISLSKVLMKNFSMMRMSFVGVGVLFGNLNSLLEFLTFCGQHGKLLTNEHRATRGLTEKITCERCKGGCEDCEHVFRGCVVSCGIWEDICKGVTKIGMFAIDWKEWLCQNLNVVN
ncbi:hypothetical protein Ddye_023972 [Dipteronia dyeriana]|uniref:Reverse transcriptase domain-containing protein n=1 Tax=Dipteronia dyeriana TaxID=168575 RepID=A0AAD9WSK1_9ROSI|nr:hypothetical protein Ddye_023972 [Dipteronia dyeriana]